MTDHTADLTNQLVSAEAAARAIAVAQHQLTVARDHAAGVASSSTATRCGSIQGSATRQRKTANRMIEDTQHLARQAAQTIRAIKRKQAKHAHNTGEKDA